MKKIIVLILLLALVPAYFFYQKNNKNEQQEMDNKKIAEPVKEEVKETSPSSSATYSLDEIAKHSIKEDCWFAIEGKVYDVSKFSMSGKHPGGDAILQGCGKDATVLFNTRPMGSGTPHSDKARYNLSNFLIGDLSK